jgi:hypothetical protein
VPLVIFADQKDAYLDALERADEGEPQAFVSFVNERAIDTIELVRSSLRAHSSDVDSSLARLHGELLGRAGLSHGEFDAVNARLGQLLVSKVNERLGQLALPAGVQVQPAARKDAQDGHAHGAPAGYRPAPHSLVTFALAAGPPADVARTRSLRVWSAKPDHPGADFVITPDGPFEPLEVLLREIHPAETQILDLKLANWFETLLTEEMSVFSRQVHEALVGKGYRPEDPG